MKLSWIQQLVQTFGTNTNSARANSLNKARQELIGSLDGAIAAAEKDVLDNATFISNLENKELTKSEVLFDLCIYSSITTADLLILLEKLVLVTRNHEKLLFARLIAMTVSEYLKDIDSLIGHRLVEEMHRNNHTELIPELLQLHQEFARCRKENQKRLSEIRNKTVAHKLTHGPQLVSHIYSVDSELMFELGKTIVSMNSRLNNFNAKLLNRVVEKVRDRREELRLQTENVRRQVDSLELQNEKMRRHLEKLRLQNESGNHQSSDV